MVNVKIVDLDNINNEVTMIAHIFSLKNMPVNTEATFNMKFGEQGSR